MRKMTVEVEIINKYNEYQYLVMFYDSKVQIGTIINWKEDNSEKDGLMKWEIIGIRKQ